MSSSSEPQVEDGPADDMVARAEVSLLPVAAILQTIASLRSQGALTALQRDQLKLWLLACDTRMLAIAQVSSVTCFSLALPSHCAVLLKLSFVVFTEMRLKWD